MLKNQKGISLVYVLMSLVAVGAIGALVLNMAKKEQADTSLRASSEMARFAANAGLTYATNFFTDTTTATQTRALDILRHWYANWRGGGDLTNINDNNIWIAGDEDSYLDTNGMKFRVRIMNIDFNSIGQVSDVSNPPNLINDPNTSPIIILFRSEAVDKSGSRASSFGTYRIIGFEDREVPKQEITHALYLGGGSILINCRIDINGDTYIGGQNSTRPPIKHTQQSNWPPYADDASHYRGEFRLYGGGDSAALLANERFHGPAYFEGGEVQFAHFGTTNNIFYGGFGGSNVTFRHTTGSPATMSAVNSNNVPIVRNLAIFSDDVNYAQVNTTNQWQLSFSANGALRYNKPTGNFVTNFYRGSISTANIDSTTPVTKDCVLKALGMSDEPPSFEIDLTPEILARKRVLPSGVGAGTVNGTYLNNWFNDANPNFIDNNGNQWLVIETGSNVGQFGGGGNAFNGNIIVINRHAGNAAGSLFNMSNNAVALFFIPPDNHPTLVPLTQTVSYGASTGTFNGLFYNGSKSTTLTIGGALNTAGGTSWTVNGAFYNIGNRGDPTNNAQIWIGASGSNGPVRIDFHSSAAQKALAAIQDLGILSFSGGGSGDFDFNRVPKTILPKPTSEMLSRSF